MRAFVSQILLEENGRVGATEAGSIGEAIKMRWQLLYCSEQNVLRLVDTARPDEQTLVLALSEPIFDNWMHGWYLNRNFMTGIWRMDDGAPGEHELVDEWDD